MIKRSRTDPHIVTLSASAYRLLLAFYPARFRLDYGDQMAQVFRDCCIRVYSHSGLPGLISLWVHTLSDWFKTVIEEQLNRGTSMTHHKFIRLSGWGMIVAAISLLLTFLPEANILLNGIYQTLGMQVTTAQHELYQKLSGGMRSLPFPLAITLITAGLLGLGIRYGGQGDRMAKLALGLGVLGGAASSMIAVSMLANIPNGRTAMNISMAFMFAGLFVFGLSAIRNRIMPRGNILPALAGFWWPFIVINAYLVPLLTGQQSPGIPGWLSFALFSIMSVSLGLLGYMLQADVPQGKEIPSL